jgi:hypothetical protein
MMATEFVAVLRGLIAEQGDAPLYWHEDDKGAIEPLRVVFEESPVLENGTPLPPGFLVY